MRKVLFFLALLFTMQTASAQLNDIYLRDEIVLSDNQWHFDDHSVIQANNGMYLVITPNNHYYRQLLPFDRLAFELSYGIGVLGYRPYVYNNCLGWYIQGYGYNYFYDPYSGFCARLSHVPVFYNFYYAVQNLRHLNLRLWHWRNTGRYHHLWHPPHHHHYHHHVPLRPNNPPRGHGHYAPSRPNTPPRGHGNYAPSRPNTPPRGHGNYAPSRPSTPPKGHGNQSSPRRR